MYYIAIVGRPNVGKSTLFNKIVGGRPAIVDDTPGVTRDRNISIVEKAGRRFGVIDSGGFEPDSKDDILSRVREQTLMAIEEADIIFFIVDGREGITSVDEEISKRLRKAGKPVLLVVNKIDNPSQHDDIHEFGRLGFERIFPVSSEHSIGIESLMETAYENIPENAGDIEEEADRPIHIAVVGKPNVGKSSIINKILKTDRMTVSEIPGTTRDAIDSTVERGSEKFVIIDTAGIRRKAKVTLKLEKYSVIMAIKAIERADVALLMIDAIDGVSAQEAKIAGLIQEAGCACVIVVNKWDSIEKDDKTTLVYENAVRKQLKFLAYAPILFVSAATGQRVEKIWDVVTEVYSQYSKRIGTGELNKLITEVTTRKVPPIYRNKRVKLYYATQASVRPPTFVMMTNAPKGIHFSYRRYIVNRIRSNAGFEKTPIRIIFRKPAGRRVGSGAKV